MTTLAPTACPACRAGLDRDRCAGCGRHFPPVAGLADFRVGADRFLGLADERAKAERMARVAPGTDLAGLARFYYRITADVEPRRRGFYLAHILRAEARGEALAALLPREGRVLEVGCGTGGLVAAAARSGRAITGTDVAARWLVVARRRLDDLGLRADLVAASADRLPWADGTFDAVVADSLLEHLDDPSAAVREWARVLRPGGSLLAWSPNRFAPVVDPHVRLWGIGFLPRAWMPGYVRLRRGPMHAPPCLSAAEAAGMARRAGFTAIRVDPPAIPAGWAATRPAGQRALIRLYRGACGVPGLGPALAAVAPLWQLRATRRGAA